MSSPDVRYPTNSGRASPPVVTPHYGSSLPNPPTDLEDARKTRCVTGPAFLKSINGILNLIIIIALVCVIISAGVSNRNDARRADSFGTLPKARVSAFHTRNAVLVFAVITLFLMLVDTILHVTRLINRLPAVFDLIFIVVMLVLAGILLILGCCAAAWEQKMSLTSGLAGGYRRKGAAASAAFFLFVAMLAIIVNFVLRLLRPAGRTDS